MQNVTTFIDITERFGNLPFCQKCCNAVLRCKCYRFIACENIRFSSLFAAGDVSRGGTSATQQQKFHTELVKSVRNRETSPAAKSEEKQMFSQAITFIVAIATNGQLTFTTKIFVEKIRVELDNNPLTPGEA